MRGTELTEDQQCVLLNAVEAAYLFSMLAECAAGQDWEKELLPQAPYLAEIVEDMVKRGWVILTMDSGEQGQPPVSIPTEQVHAVLSEPSNWWSRDGVRRIALVATEEGRQAYRHRSTPSDPNDVGLQL